MTEPVPPGERMTDTDALMWIIEADPQLRSTITLVTLLDGTPDREHVQYRIDRASRGIPKLRQRVVANPYSVAPPRWEVDPGFDLSYHLRWFSVGGDGSLGDVLRIAQPIAMQGFDRARPLWEFTFVEGLAGGRSALIAKVHHAITDGVGGVELMLELFDGEPDPPNRHRPLPPEPEARPLDQGERVVDALRHELGRGVKLAQGALDGALGAQRDPVGAGRQLAATADSATRMLRPTGSPLSPIMTERSLSLALDTYQAPVDDLKAAGRRADGSLNDAFLAFLCRGLHLYHERMGAPIRSLRMGMPISVRRDDQAAGGNAFVPARFEVPVDLADPVEHMAVLGDLVSRQRREPALDLVDPLAGFLTRLPASLTTGVLGLMMRGIDFQASNVPGLPVPVWFEGVPVSAQIPFGPAAGCALNVTLLSYAGTAHVGCNIDPAAVTDRRLLRSCMDESLAEILDLGRDED